jgi:hypothetical protein
MIDPSALVIDGNAIHAAAMKFPVTAQLDSAGLAPTKFLLAQVPGTQESPEWAALVWKANPTGGEPLLMLSEPVARVVVFTPSNIVLDLTNGQKLSITPEGSCGCGQRLKSWQPWGNAVRVHGVSGAVVTG